VDDRVIGLNAAPTTISSSRFPSQNCWRESPRLAADQPRPTVETRLRLADLEVNLLDRAVTRGGDRIELLPREFELLVYLMKHLDQTVTRAMLLENVDPNTSIVETHISRLRSKIDRGQSTDSVATYSARHRILSACLDLEFSEHRAFASH
jgi:two-component system OmpR family response regulator